MKKKKNVSCNYNNSLKMRIMRVGELNNARRIMRLNVVQKQLKYE